MHPTQPRMPRMRTADYRRRRNIMQDYSTRMLQPLLNPLIASVLEARPEDPAAFIAHQLGNTLPTGGHARPLPPPAAKGATGTEGRAAAADDVFSRCAGGFEAAQSFAGEMLEMDMDKLSSAGAFAEFVEGVAAALVSGAAGALSAADPDAVAQCRLGDGGAGLFALLAERLRDAQMTARAAAAVGQVHASSRTRCKNKVFAFGGERDFKGGLAQMIGLPKGVNATQWLHHMEAEHCLIESGWGASKTLPGQEWTTGNYFLTTSPLQEWRWIMHQEWDGVAVEHTPGGFESEERSRENTAVRRVAISINTLIEAAPGKIHAMLAGLAAERARPFELTVTDVAKMFAKTAINVPEITALRLYTGPMFEFYNTALRAVGGMISGGSRYPMQDGMDTAGRFVTTMHAVNSGLLKLSTLTPCMKVYRGTRGREMPMQLEVADKFASRVGIQLGFMSTTTDMAVAKKYGKDRQKERNLSFVSELEMDSLNRGALIQWLSQYPGEREVLFGPLTGMEHVRESAILDDRRQPIRHLFFRTTSNQRAVLIEELVARRKLVHTDMLDNLRLVLSDPSGEATAPPELLALWDHMQHSIRKTPPAQFNDDAFYRTVLCDAIDTKNAIQQICLLVKAAKAAPAWADQVSDPTPFPALQFRGSALDAPWPHDAPNDEKTASLFEWADQDGDGSLSRQEFGNAHAVLGPTGRAALLDSEWAGYCQDCKLCTCGHVSPRSVAGAKCTCTADMADGIRNGPGLWALWGEPPSPAADAAVEVAEAVVEARSAWLDQLRLKIGRARLWRRLLASASADGPVAMTIAKLSIDPLAAQLVLAARQQQHPTSWEPPRLVGATVATLDSLHAVGLHEETSGNFSKAAECFEKAAAGRDELLGTDHLYSLNSRFKLAEVLRNITTESSETVPAHQKFPRLDDAKEVVQRTLEAQTRTLGAYSPITLETQIVAGQIYSRAGDVNRDPSQHAVAQPLLATALEACRGTLGKIHPLTLDALGKLGSLHSRKKEFDIAEPLVKEAWDLRRQVLGEEHEDTLSSASALVQVYLGKGKQACTVAEEGAVDGGVDLALKNYRLAAPLCEQVLAGRALELGVHHPDTKRTQTRLDGLVAIIRKLEEARAEPEAVAAVDGEGRGK